MRVNSLESDYYRASFMKNLSKDGCSESEGSGSEGDGGTGDEGGGSCKGFGSATTSSLLSIGGHGGPGSGFFSGETGQSSVNLSANFLGLEPFGGQNSNIGQLKSSRDATSG